MSPLQNENTNITIKAININKKIISITLTPIYQILSLYVYLKILGKLRILIKRWARLSIQNVMLGYDKINQYYRYKAN